MLFDVEIYVQKYEMALFRDFCVYQKKLKMVLLGFSYAPKSEKMDFRLNPKKT